VSKSRDDLHLGEGGAGLAQYKRRTFISRELLFSLLLIYILQFTENREFSNFLNFFVITLLPPSVSTLECIHTLLHPRIPSPSLLLFSTFTMSTNGNSNGVFAYHSASTTEAIQAENDFAAHNYHPLPIVFSRAQGTSVWDPEGRHYLDFLSAYSAVNQGHCHPELVKALVDQASRLTLSSRAFYNDVFPRFAEFVTRYFGFDMVLPMNTGAEAVETGIKIARKWGYKVKGIPENKAIVLSAENNFHGRTVSSSLSQ
jgi:hypothetical protein